MYALAPESASLDPAFSNSGAGVTLQVMDLSSSTCADLVTLTNNSSEDADTAVKGAYIHDSKVLEDDIVASDCTKTSWLQPPAILALYPLALPLSGLPLRLLPSPS